MNKYNRHRNNCKKYSNIKLSLSINGKYNQECYNILKDALEKSGFLFEIKDNNLSLSILESKYVRNKYRNAGRNLKSITRKDNFLPYKYSDIIYMLNNMTDIEIYTKLKISSATYYRHKKKLMTSVYYDSLDLAQINNLEYLESMPNNDIF